MPTAWATALLAWGVLAFPQGWARAGGTAEALGAVRWGTDYLLKTFHPYTGRAGGYVIAHQVRSCEGCVLVWPPRPPGKYHCGTTPNVLEGCHRSAHLWQQMVLDAALVLNPVKCDALCCVLRESPHGSG